MRIVVTGGTGFLGKRLVQKLADGGHKVSVLARHDHEEMPPGIKVFTGDIRNISQAREAISKADVVYHLAICLNEADPEMWNINVEGTRNIVKCCKEGKVKQLIYMSSSGVLGETKEASREEMPYNPRTEYERSKAESEKIIRDSGIPYTIVRTTIILGPNLVWFKIFDAAKKGYPIIGSGKNYFHLVYVEDVVDLLCLVLGNKKAMNQVFHIASKDTPTYGEVYGMICKELKCEMTQKHIPARMAYLMSAIHTRKRKLQGKQPSLTMMRSSIDRLIRNRIISIDKSRKVLGFEPKYSTQQAVHETVKYLKIAHLGYSDFDLAQIKKVKSK